jgi:S1-C subfamily serine protease
MAVFTSPRTWTRETRLLVLTVLISGAVLGLLAQFRFPEQTRAETIPQPLEQIAARATYDELAAIVGRVQPRVAPSLVVLRAARHAASTGRTLRDVAATSTADAPFFVPALRVRADIVVARLDADVHVHAVVGDDAAVPLVLSTDPLRGIALVRVPAPPEGTAWQWRPTPSVATPSYVAAVEGTRGGVTLRPLFLGRSDRFQEPRWAAPLLALGAAPVTAEGAFIVAFDGTVLGMAIAASGGAAVVPAEALAAAADALLSGQPPPLDFGLTLQPLDAPVARAVGATAGVLVASVAPGAAADRLLRPGDLIQAIDGEPIGTVDVALVRLARTSPGASVQFTVRRDGQTVDIPVVARPVAATAAPGGGIWPGLTLDRGTPAHVESVEPGGAAASAGLVPGDVLVQLAELSRPAARDARTRLAAVTAGGRVVVVVERQGLPRVLALERP